MPNLQLFMILHTLALNYRTILHTKTTFFINLIGLSTALASTLLIYLWILDELSFDKFHKKDGRLFQVLENIRNNDGIVTMLGFKLTFDGLISYVVIAFITGVLAGSYPAL